MRFRAMTLWGLLLAGGWSAAGGQTPPPGDAQAGAQNAFACAACHGLDGNSRSPRFPSLAGQHAGYIVRQLQAFKSGERPSRIMLRKASAMSLQDMRDFAAHFASQRFQPATEGTQPSAAGARLFHEGKPERGVPACATCHGVDGAGIAGAAPRLAGQRAVYVRNVLGAWQAGTTWGSSAIAHIMPSIANNLSPQDVDALANYITQMPLPASAPATRSAP